MKKLTHLLITMLLTGAAFGFASCGSDDEPLVEDITPIEEPEATVPETTEPEVSSRGAIPIPLEGTQQAINNQLNDFAWKLFTEAYAQKTEAANILLSPLSLEIALSMFQNGLVADDQQELLKTMGLDAYSSEEVNGYFKTMIAGIVEADDLATLEIANSFWYRNDMKINADFQQQLEENFDAKVESAAFDDSTIDAINQWCAEKTHDRITKLYDSPDDANVFALLNAVYFKAGWEIPFDKKLTEDLPFHYADGTTADIPMMQKNPAKENISDYFNYIENADYQALALPFRNKAFMWFAFLPREDKSIAETLPLITAETLKNLAENKGRVAQIIVPKYEINYSVGNLVKIMESINPDLRFKELNFQGAFDTLLPPDIEISALQKTFFLINEEGAEAAAVTGVAGVTSVPPPVVFNRPFIYGIMETSTNCPMFIGYFGDNTD